MKYKDLLGQYKQGTLNEEDKLLVEKELEKQEALEDYRSEIFDEELNEIGVSSQVQDHTEETTKLKRSVNKRLRKVVMLSVLIVVLLYVGIFYGVSSIMDGMYYNPIATQMSEKEETSYADFLFDMDAYISLNLPGYSIYSFSFQESKGFGNYDVSYSMQNLFTKEEQRYFISMSQGRLTSAMDGIFSTKNRFLVWEGFQKIQDIPDKYASESIKTSMDNRIEWKNEKTIEYLDELNPLSYVSMSIVFKEDQTLEELYQMTRENPANIFSWVGVRTFAPGTMWNDPQPNHLVGFKPGQDGTSYGVRPDFEKYPLFRLMDWRNYPDIKKKEYPQAMVEAYAMHFKTRLEYLRDREEFVEIFDYNPLKTTFYNDALEYIEDHGIKTYGGLIYGTPDELREFIDKVPYASIHINEVSPIKPNIYSN